MDVSETTYHLRPQGYKGPGISSNRCSGSTFLVLLRTFSQSVTFRVSFGSLEIFFFLTPFYTDCSLNNKIVKIHGNPFKCNSTLVVVVDRGPLEVAGVESQVQVVRLPCGVKVQWLIGRDRDDHTRPQCFRCPSFFDDSTLLSFCTVTLLVSNYTVVFVSFLHF